VVFSFVCSVTSPATNGIFTLSLPAANSINLEASRSLIYDVKISWTNGDVKKWLSGDVEIIDTVTQ
jgi:hypothetical protein